MAYPMYGNYNNQYYMQELQGMKDRIDSQLRQYQQQSQIQQQPAPITQNFQIAPTNNNNELESKYANNIEEVRNTFVVKTGIFINKDFTNLWVKNTNGTIRNFQLTEIIEQDPKDVEIQNLKNEIERMKGMINYANESDVDSANINGADENKNAKKLSVRKQSNAK